MDVQQVLETMSAKVVLSVMTTLYYSSQENVVPVYVQLFRLLSYNNTTVYVLLFIRISITCHMEMMNFNLTF